MQRSENITGFIIKMYAAKEADQVIHLLSTKGSRHTLYAKGSRKEGSRKSFALDLLNLITAKFSSKTELGFISEVRLITSLRSQLESLHGLLSLQMLAEVVDSFCLPDHEQPGLFILVESASKLLNNDNNVMLMSAVILKLLQSSGALPDLNRDIYSEDLIEQGEDRYLSPEIGYTKRGSTSVSDRIYKVQQFMINNTLADGIRISLSEPEQKQLIAINSNWLVHHLESDIKSLQLFLQSLQS